MAVTHEWDVIVLGSGAAGLTAAVTAAKHGLSVGLYEKSDYIGGTSAWSGGNVWVPCNPHQRAIGVSDSQSEAFEYVMSLSRDLLDEDQVHAYLHAAPEMVRFLDAYAGTDFYAIPDWPDYHPENPGGKPNGGRTVECPVFPFEKLGRWAAKVRQNPYNRPKRNCAMIETPLGAIAPGELTDEELQDRQYRDARGCGQSLIGRLLKACLDQGVEPCTSVRARELITEGGRVVGVRLESPEGSQDGLIEAHGRRGVVLATGGFEWNEEYRRTFLRGPLTHPMSVETNTGDGLYMAMKAGAMLSNMREAWWAPVTEFPPGVNGMNQDMVNIDRSRPRSIMVNRRGVRFANEAVNYNAFGSALHEDDAFTFTYPNLPSWLIFDQGYLRRYGTVGPHPPGEHPPSWLTGYGSLTKLAVAHGIDGAKLMRTVEQWNRDVEQGHDSKFGRGLSAHNRWWGDKDYFYDARSTLGPIDTPPYYALQVHIGALGTRGGPRVDTSSRVLDLDGQPIVGLYAAGNVMGSPLGAVYGGAGGTLGPAMVYAYIAATDIAGVSVAA